MKYLILLALFLTTGVAEAKTKYCLTLNYAGPHDLNDYACPVELSVTRRQFAQRALNFARPIGKFAGTLLGDPNAFNRWLDKIDGWVDLDGVVKQDFSNYILKAHNDTIFNKEFDTVYDMAKSLKVLDHMDEATNLDEAEREMLELTVKRAQIQDGDSILELGHGWGSLTLFMAEKFPNSRVKAISNSKSQGEYIRSQAKERGLTNIEIETADMNEFKTSEKFNRVVSVEMFEHMRNYPELFNRISSWLTEKGTLFIHIFCHKELVYKFEVKDQTDWMSKYFFSGGIMPSHDLFTHYNDDMYVAQSWIVNGIHYAKTCRAWLNKMDENKTEIMQIFENHYPAGEASKWFEYWRIFYMSCEELFAYNSGEEWYVGHYLMQAKNS